MPPAVPEAHLVPDTSAQRSKSRRALVTAFAAPALDQNPVAVYLARFPSKDARRVQLAALKTVAREFREADPFKLPWGELRYQHVVLLRTKFTEKLAPATVNRYLAAIRGVVKEAVRLNVMDASEGAKIEGVENVRGSRLPAGRHLDEARDLTPLFEAAESHENPAIAVRDQALLAVLRIGGLRRSEVVGIQVRDLDWGKAKRLVQEKKRERVEREVYTLDGSFSCKIRGKGNKERVAYFGNASNELRAWLKVRGMQPGPLFCAVHKTGSIILRPMDPSSVRFIVERAGKAAGVTDVAPHDFRRTFVGDLLDQGTDISTVQKLAGHASVSTTQRYDRRPEKAAEKAGSVLQVPGRSKSASR